MTERSAQADKVAAPKWLTPQIKVVISLAIGFHLLAVFMPPFALVPSPLSGPVKEATDWYTGPLRLQNGYRFFSPDPPLVSLVLRYEIDLPNGETLEGIFPNHDDYWPRLYYHRHLMLTSRLQSLGYSTIDVGLGNKKPILNDGSLGAWYVAGKIERGEYDDLDQIPDADYNISPAEIPEPFRREPDDRQETRTYVASYAEHLLHKHNADRVRLYLLEHAVPSRLMAVEQDVALDAPESYRQSLLIDLSKAEEL